ncbi:unnamed protein product [Withania somnifera]
MGSWKSIKVLRQRNLYAPELKFSETMEKRGMNKTTRDQAIHLDLVAKSKGIEAAENYFLNLPETSKNHFTYYSLLNYYCKELMTEKAEALMEKMKELKLGLSAMPYNSLMTLYTKTGHPEKIPAIVQEMKAYDVIPDSYTYNVWMRALSSVNDISGVERVIDEMKRDGRITEDWTTYSNLASIYADAGLNDKAVKALKELEKKNACHNLTAYQFLITLYGRVSNLLEVYRLNMIQVLVNLNDLPGAEKCFKEWEFGCSTYDIRIANVLIGAYTRQGSLEKAEQLKERARRTLDCVDKAVSIGRGDGGKWFPSSATVTKFMSHFEQNKDVAGAEHLMEILKKVKDELGVDVFESLLRTYKASEKTSPIMRRRIKMENIELSNEGKRLLDCKSVE